MHRGPDFLIIGAQKGGTESAMHYFASHPELFMPRQEVHYFDRDDRGLQEEYENLFCNAQPHQLCGEKTPRYIYLRECAPRIAAMYPKCKLILFLRDPVSRALSQLNMAKQQGYALTEQDLLEGMSGSVAENIHGLIGRGLYLQQIQHYLQYFSRDQLYIAFSEKVRQNPREAYDAIFEWLGVSPMPLHIPYCERHIRDYSEHVSDSTIAELARFYAEPNRKLFEYLEMNKQCIAELGWATAS